MSFERSSSLGWNPSSVIKLARQGYSALFGQTRIDNIGTFVIKPEHGAAVFLPQGCKLKLEINDIKFNIDDVRSVKGANMTHVFRSPTDSNQFKALWPDKPIIVGSVSEDMKRFKDLQSLGAQVCAITLGKSGESLFPSNKDSFSIEAIGKMPVTVRIEESVSTEQTTTPGVTYELAKSLSDKLDPYLKDNILRNIQGLQNLDDGGSIAINSGIKFVKESGETFASYEANNIWQNLKYGTFSYSDTGSPITGFQVQKGDFRIPNMHPDAKIFYRQGEKGVDGVWYSSSEPAKLDTESGIWHLRNGNVDWSLLETSSGSTCAFTGANYETGFNGSKSVSWGLCAEVGNSDPWIKETVAEIKTYKDPRKGSRLVFLNEQGQIIGEKLFMPENRDHFWYPKPSGQ